MPNGWVRDSFRYDDEKLLYLRLSDVGEVEIAHECPMVFQIGLFFKGDQRIRIYSGDKAKGLLRELGLDELVATEVARREAKE